MGKTTISVDDDVKQALADLGSKGDSFNEIIRALLEERKKKK